MAEKLVQGSKKLSVSPKLARDLREGAIACLLFLAALSSVATTVGILIILVSESVGFFQKVSLIEFLTDTEWTPLFADPHYGILPLVAGTLVITGVSMAVAIPLGTIIAIYLSEFASSSVREVIKPALELLAGIPSVVYGYFAFLFVTPLLQTVMPDLPGFN
ncbi:MAG TPA: phosphate ABC transporter permease subunit PstC, partial [Kamptonema sp.]|nr:phosphate ABC transporter permease subunit PstC [Kamptonema sp.]